MLGDQLLVPVRCALLLSKDRTGIEAEGEGDSETEDRPPGRVRSGSRNSDVDPAVAVTPDGIAIKIQLLRGTRYEPWPTETREIEQRYRDAPPAILRVPTLLSFAGWKTASWMDRGAARDLYDLWALDKVGALNAESAGLFATHGAKATTSGHPIGLQPARTDQRIGRPVRPAR